MAEEQNVPSSTPGKQRHLSPEIIGAAVLAVVLLIFIVQNDEDVKVSWVVFSRRGALWIVILASAVLGYVIGQLIEYGLKRRRARNAKS